MRNLSKIEKEIIKNINAHKSGNMLTGLLGCIAKEMIIEVNKITRVVTATALNSELLSGAGEKELEDFFFKRIYFINTLFTLLTYLEKEGYIVTYTLSNKHPDSRLIGESDSIHQFKTQGAQAGRYNFDNDFIINSFINYRDSLIVSTEELRLFEKNKFKTKEEKRFRINVRISIAAIIVAFLMGLFGLLASIENQGKPLKINQAQIDSIAVRLDRIIKNQKKIERHYRQSSRRSLLEKPGSASHLPLPHDSETSSE
ncbi:hypothetical protein [Sunxiuqinia rutila]|uniref:hypothetical protein n=1 Tax=Sunxiuqinia rutila TaxID=1397841 RepID=UPI003D35E032